MSAYGQPLPEGAGVLAERILRIEAALRDLQQPLGSNVASLVSQVQQTLANINAQVAEAVSLTSYTKAQIDDRVANAGTYYATLALAAVTATNVTASGQVYSELPLRSPGSRSYVATTNYVAGWINSDGTIGTVPSSRRFKDNIVDADIDPYAIMSVGVKSFEYIAELRKRDDPTYEEYVGPDYHVQSNTNVIAEELHEAGLWQFVVYEREPVYEDILVWDETDEEFKPVQAQVGEKLKLDENGNEIPYSVHNIMFGVMLIPTVQALVRRLDEVERRLTSAGL